jgi:hypothetical protein
LYIDDFVETSGRIQGCGQVDAGGSEHPMG